MSRKWNEILIAEHKLLERIVDILEKETNSIIDGSENLTLITRIFNLLLDFGDKIHNVKEENHLFPTMIERGIPQSEHIHDMLLDHEVERELIARFLLKLPAFTNLPYEEKAVLVKKIKEYTNDRKKHIKEENDILYPLAERVFLPEDNDKLVAAFKIIDKDVYGEDAYAHYALITEQLEKERERPEPLIRKLSYEQLESILDVLPDELIFIDTNNRIQYFNKGVNRQLHPIKMDSTEDHPDNFIPPHIQADLTTIVEKLKKRELSEISFWYKSGDRFLFVTFRPVFSKNGSYIGILESAQDISKFQSLTGEKTEL